MTIFNLQLRQFSNLTHDFLLHFFQVFSVCSMIRKLNCWFQNIRPCVALSWTNNGYSHSQFLLTSNLLGWNSTFKFDARGKLKNLRHPPPRKKKIVWAISAAKPRKHFRGRILDKKNWWGRIFRPFSLAPPLVTPLGIKRWSSKIKTNFCLIFVI